MPLATFSFLLGMLVIAIGLLGAIDWKRRQHQGEGVLVEMITDPREAITILMVRLARVHAALTPADRETMATMLRTRFDLDAERADELLGFGEVAADRMDNLEGSLTPLVIPLRRHLTPAQKDDAVAMLRVVADFDGGPVPEQLAVIRRIDTALSG